MYLHVSNRLLAITLFQIIVIMKNLFSHLNSKTLIVFVTVTLKLFIINL